VKGDTSVIENRHSMRHSRGQVRPVIPVQGDNIVTIEFHLDVPGIDQKQQIARPMDMRGRVDHGPRHIDGRDRPSLSS
jgi:hypothetical protein